MAPLAIQIRIASKETESARTEEEEAIAKALRAGASLAADGSFQEEEEEAPSMAGLAAEYQAKRTEAIKDGAADTSDAIQRSERAYMLAKRAEDKRGSEPDAYMARCVAYDEASQEADRILSGALRIAYDAGYAAGTLAS
jgi:hypothetical protein